MSDIQTQTSSNRFFYVISNFVGRTVTLQHKDGGEYEGVVHAFAIPQGIELLLVSRKGRLDERAKKPEKRVLFAIADIVRIDCKYNMMEDVHGTRTHVLNEVRADTEISSGTRGEERPLQAWVQSDDGTPGSAAPPAVPLDDWDDVNRKKQFAGWDQFTVNEQQFGVKSTYDETLYTTVLDKGKVSREQEAVANKLAAEIEGTAATHAHIAEERGQEIEGNDKYDEEARYSTVLRAGEEGIQAVGAGAGGGGQGGGGAQGADGRSGEARADASASSGAPAAEPAKSKLNPNAKSFVFNPKAKAFVPGGSGSGGARPAMPAVAGQYGCAGFPANAGMMYPGAAAGMGAAPGGMPVSPGPYQQMMRPGNPQYMLGGAQGFPSGSPPQMPMGSMGGGMVRAPPNYPMPPTPPGQGMFPPGAAQMAAMRGMQAGSFAPYSMMGGQPQGMTVPSPGAPGRFQGAPPSGFGGPQPPRQATYQPRMG